MKKIYIPVALAKNLTLTLDDAIFHYVVRVLRCRDGENLSLFNGDGFDYLATLAIQGKRKACVSILDCQKNTNESPLHITLIQGLSKGERMDFVMQKTVELGVNRIIPIQTDYSAVKLDKQRLLKKNQHWQSIITSACEQCQRSSIPTLEVVTTLPAALAEIDADVKWVLHPYSTHFVTAPKQETVRRVALLIGPEGGFSDEEIQSALAHQFIPKILGKRILRTETAAISALSLCQQQWGDWHV